MSAAASLMRKKFWIRMSERGERLHHHYGAMISSCRASLVRLLTPNIHEYEWDNGSNDVFAWRNWYSISFKTWTHSSLTHMILSVPDCISLCFYVRSLTPSLGFLWLGNEWTVVRISAMIADAGGVSYVRLVCYPHSFSLLRFLSLSIRDHVLCLVSSGKAGWRTEGE